MFVIFGASGFLTFEGFFIFGVYGLQKLRVQDLRFRLEGLGFGASEFGPRV